MSVLLFANFISKKVMLTVVHPHYEYLRAFFTILVKILPILPLAILQILLFVPQGITRYERSQAAG